MEILKIKKSQESYIVNDSIYVPKIDGNSDYEKIKKWIEGGGIVEPEFSLQEIKAHTILKIKSQAYSRIANIYPEYKQLNLNGIVSFIQNKELLALKAGLGNYTPTEDEITSLQAAKACKDFIDAIRTKSNQLEASLDSMTEEQLNAFDPSEDSNWE